MNLTTDPWIPALRADGRRDLFSLQDLFAQAHTLHDLAAKPHERVALMRLLLCITQAALDGPADEREWATCQPHIRRRVPDYLTTWKAAFELFGDGQRFLQVSGLKAEKKSGEKTRATKLDLALATGNNATLFDNHAAEDRSIQNARTALNLLTFQCFTPSQIVGAGSWGETEIPKRTGRQAPCAASAMVHTLLLGSNLCETIWLNLFDRELVTDLYGPNGWGVPIWENPLTSPTRDNSYINATRTYLGRLVPQSRLVICNASSAWDLAHDQPFGASIAPSHLQPGCKSILLVDGVLDYQLFDDPKNPRTIVYREPHSTILAENSRLALLRGDISKSLWRELGAIVAKRKGEKSVQEGPPALTRRPGNRDMAVWIGSLVTTKKDGIVDCIEGRYPLPKEMFTELGRAAYEHGVAHAEEREAVLIQAVKAYAASLKVVAPAYDRARQQFWTRVEQHLTALFDLARDPNLVADLPNSAWGKAVAAAARAAYEQSCPRQTPRQIQAYALGLRKLTWRPPAGGSRPTNRERKPDAVSRVRSRGVPTES